VAKNSCVLQDTVGRQVDGGADSLALQLLVQLGLGEGRIAAEEALEPTPAVALVDARSAGWHACPAGGTLVTFGHEPDPGVTSATARESASSHGRAGSRASSAAASAASRRARTVRTSVSRTWVARGPTTRRAQAQR
jgi:hypothetical protein